MTKKEKELKVLFNEARIAGLEAVSKCTPTPMVVSDPNSGKNWFVPDGVCGFAWVTIYPGNCAAANYAKKYLGARHAYKGGTSIWVSEFDQSMGRKETYAAAFANVLYSAGIKAYSNSRMD